MNEINILNIINDKLNLAYETKLKLTESLSKAKEDAEQDLSIDLIAVSLYDAYTAILEILGEANQLDISREIFSRFCVGK